MFLLSVLTVWLYVFHAVCLGQQVSSLWRKPNVTMSRVDRVGVAEAALEKAITFLDTTALFPDAVWVTTISENTLAPYSNYSFPLPGKINDGLHYGHGAAVAYEKYKTGVFLEYAEQVWWAAKAFTLGQNDVSKGTVPYKDFTISPTCGGITTAGATFREKSSTAGDINVQATGGFLVYVTSRYSKPLASTDASV
ncbi:Glycoside hydrolase family 76 protein [Mycena venus]|uniref:Glycoside hydrolase family 76 protein n=1 Tax=Mycena venus TaxID=2733690 RepID=A0A8H7CDU7_9AGAR|nr:Glycoside hydrolase family 76 protein [Mycena venus]